MGANNTFNPIEYGNGTDDAAWQAAICDARAAKGAIVLSPGVEYKPASPCVLDWPYASIGSAVPGVRARITYQATDGDVIVMKAGVGKGMLHVGVHDLHIDSAEALCTAPPAITGQNMPLATTRTGRGVFQDGFIGRSSVNNIYVTRQRIGLQLDSTEYGTVSDIRSELNVSHGIFMYATQAQPLQWYWSGQNLSEVNGGDGFRMSLDPTRAAGAGVMSSGDICNISTWANAGRAIAFYGFPTCPLWGLRLRGGFVGGDQGDLIYFDTYGAEHQISDMYGETGEQRGINITANNSLVRVSNCGMSGNRYAGFQSMADDVEFIGCRALSNGRYYPDKGEVQQAPWGFYLGGRRNSVIGGKSGNGTTQYQRYGVVNGLAPVNGVQASQVLVGHNGGVLSATNPHGNLDGATSGPFASPAAF